MLFFFQCNTCTYHYFLCIGKDITFSTIGLYKAISAKLNISNLHGLKEKKTPSMSDVSLGTGYPTRRRGLEYRLLILVHGLRVLCSVLHMPRLVMALSRMAAHIISHTTVYRGPDVRVTLPGIEHLMVIFFENKGLISHSSLLLW